MRKKKLYVVGYDEDDESIFGNGNEDILEPLDETTAKKLADEYSEYKAVVYKLVKVDLKKKGA